MQSKKEHGLVSNIIYSYKILFDKKKSYKFLIPFLILITFISTTISSFIASFIVYLIENGFNINSLIIGICAFIGVYLVLHLLAAYLNQTLSMGYTIFRASYPFYKMLRFCFEMDYQKFEEKETKDLFMKASDAVSSNLAGLEGIYHIFPEIIITVLGLILFGFTTIFISPWVFLIVLLSIIINFLIVYFVRKKDAIIREDLSKVNNKVRYFSNISAHEVEAKDIRNYSLSKKFKEMLTSYNKELKKHLYKIGLIWFLPSLELSLFSLIRDLLAYAILIYKAVNGEIGASEFTALLAAVTAFNSYVDQIATKGDNLIQCSQSMAYFREFFDINSNFSHENRADLKVLESPFDIKIKNISFKYLGSDKYIFKDFSLDIKKNQKIAIVGINGAGKTTLAKLLVGLYAPNEGEIIVNDHNIKDFNIDDYYKYVSIVNQDVTPLAFTIKDNIVCSEIYNEEKFKKVLSDSGFKEKVDSLENKEETFLTQNFDRKGINLSGGENQKMLLARALYKDSSFLILDEPTSALDPIAEGELYEKYASLTKNKTSIFISHRLSSTRFCDVIYFIEDGKILEQGTHDELMKKKGRYFEMFNIQAKYYRKEGEEVNENI